MQFQFPGSRRWLVLFAGVTAVSMFAACASAPSNPPAPDTTIALSDGRYTPLGRVRVSDQPTASNFAELQSAERGQLGLPAFVEFYADNWLICKSIEATVSGMQARYNGKVKFLRINIDDKESQPSLKKYNVRGTPTIVLLDRRGKVVSNVAGWAGDQPLEEALTKLAALP